MVQIPGGKASFLKIFLMFGFKVFFEASIEISGFNCAVASLLYAVSGVLKSCVVLSEGACSARSELVSHQVWCVVKNTPALKWQGVCCLWFELRYANQR